MHMQYLSIKPQAPYNLNLTLRPSFVSSLFIRRGEKWVKVRGIYKHFEVKMKENRLECKLPGKMSINEVKFILGLWSPPFEELISHIRDFKVKEILKRLSECYPGVRIPIDPWDFSWLLLVIILSKRADYERMVLKWCDRINNLVGDNPWKILKIPQRIILERIGKSYQIIEARNILEAFRELMIGKGILSDNDNLNDLLLLTRKLPLREPWKLRRLLLLCKGIGVKIANSIIMVTTGDTSFAPLDTHLITVSNRLGIINEEYKIPEKKFCIKYECSKCPRREKCIESLLRSKLGKLAGWYQTLVYLHGRFLCRKDRPKCDRCPLQNICTRGEYMRKG